MFNYNKDFDRWNKMKKALDGKKQHFPFPKEREVWICSVGVNVGQEQDGIGKNLARPFLIVKRFNKSVAWGIPLSTKQKDLDFYYNFTDMHDKPASAIIAQLRLISAKRLSRKLYVMNDEDFEKVVTRIRNFLPHK